MSRVRSSSLAFCRSGGMAYTEVSKASAQKSLRVRVSPSVPIQGDVAPIGRALDCRSSGCEFESRHSRHFVWPVRLVVRTQAFQACDSSSILLRATKLKALPGCLK